MCKTDFNFHFCTCASIQKKPFLATGDGVVDMEEYIKTHYIWTLYKYVGEEESLMMGSMIMPVERLNDDLTAESLTRQLNEKNLLILIINLQKEITCRSGKNIFTET